MKDYIDINTDFFYNIKYFLILTGYSQSSKKQVDGKAMQFLVKNRFAVPLLALSVFTAYNYYFEGIKPVTFSLVSKQQFLGFIAGFLSNRIALLLTEIKDEIRVEDLLSIVPGSFAEVYRESKKLDAIRDKKIADNENRKLQNGETDLSQYDERGDLINERTLSTVIVICGPQAAGRISLSSSLMSNGNCNTKIRKCKFLTSDKLIANMYPEKYNFVTSEIIEKLKSEKKIVYEGEEKSFFGNEIPVFLSLDDLTKGESSGSNSASMKSMGVGNTDSNTLMQSAGTTTASDSASVSTTVTDESKGVQIFGKTFFSKGTDTPLFKASPAILPCVIDGPPEMIEALMK